MKAFIMMILAVGFMAGCDKKPEEPGGNPDSIGTTVAPPEVKEAPVVEAKDDTLIPIEYKQQAERDITAENAAAVADELEKEIDEDID